MPAKRSAVIVALSAAWRRYPHLTFGQLLVVARALPPLPGKPPPNPEYGLANLDDGYWVERFQRLAAMPRKETT